MTPDAVQALVARCVTDPGFLRRARDTVRPAHEDAAARMAADALAADELERLARFRGFITKVKHNALRERLPHTLGLMGALGVEIAFFKAFSPAYMAARRAGPLPIAPHLELFAEMLGEFLAAWQDSRASAVAETFDHERTAFELNQLGPPSAGIVGAPVRWLGHVRWARRSLDVVQICTQLGARRFDLSRDLVYRDHILCYWLSEQGSKAVSVFEPDALTALLLSKIDRYDTPKAMADDLAALGLGTLDADAVFDFAADAERRGFVALESAWRR
jgi:hypothetical protein